MFPKSVAERYREDRVFASLVDVLYHAIDCGTYTPTEVREAAMLAQIRWEDVHVRPRTVWDGDAAIASLDAWRK